MTQGTQDTRIAELLPFFVNGTLEGEERKAVEAALARDPALAREAEALARLRSGMKAEEPAYTPGEMGLARLMREIDGTGRQPRPVSRRAWYVAAIAAAFALGAVLLAPLMLPDEPLYEQASGDAGEAALVVAFRQDAPQGEIARLLLDNGLVIVDGPSALGLYRLSPVEAVDIEALADRLAGETALIESIDTLQ